MAVLVGKMVVIVDDHYDLRKQAVDAGGATSSPHAQTTRDVECLWIE